MAAPKRTGTLCSAPGANNQDARATEEIALRQQSMQARDSNIAELLNSIAHNIGGNGCLFGYRKIAGSGTDNRNYAAASFLTIAAQHDAARTGIELGF
jgi:hypothetical protein